MFKKLYYIILTLTIPACFLVNTVFPFGSKYTVSVGTLLMYLSLIILVLADYKNFFSYVKNIVFKRWGLYYLYLIFLIYTLFSFIFIIFFLDANILSFMIPYFGGLVMQIGLATVFGGYLIYNKLSSRQLLKSITLTIFIIFIIGVVDFIVKSYNITFIINAIQCISNQRFYVFGELIPLDYVYRAQGPFIEPSVLAIISTVTLPFSYEIGLSQIKLFKNKFVNISLKKMLILFAWLNIFMTKSPIYLVFALFFTFLYFYRSIFKLLKKYLSYFIVVVTMICVFLIIFIMYMDLDLTQTYLNRILVVIDSFGNFDKLVQYESSLATRLDFYINQLCIWLQYPFFGIGIGQMKLYMADQLRYNSPVTLTFEVLCYTYSTNERMTILTGFLYKYITETGIVGIVILYGFLLRILYYLRKISVLLPKCSDKIFANTLFWFIVFFIILGLYNIGYMNTYIWCLIGCAIGLFYKIKNKGNNSVK